MYLVYLPYVGGPSEPLIQKHVGRRPARLPNDQEEDQSRNPRRRRAYNGVAGTEHLEVGDDRRVSQRRVELAALVPRFDEVFCVVGILAEVREVFTRRPHAVEDLHEDGDAPRRYQECGSLWTVAGLRTCQSVEQCFGVIIDHEARPTPGVSVENSTPRVKSGASVL